MKRITKKLLILGSAFILSTNMYAGALTGNLLVTAKLTGAQEVPAVTSNGLGLASFALNATRDTICINVSLNGLSAPVNGIHIHTGEVGVNGGIIYDLTPFLTGNRLSTKIAGAALTPAFISKFLSGGLYINAHTALNPNGEIRGQLLLEADLSYVANLDSAQEVPVTHTKAYGLGVFNLSQHKKTLQFNVVAYGLSGTITGAHLHAGAKGTAGGVVLDLGAYVHGNAIFGQVDTAGIANSATFLNDLKAGNIYVNIHTAANPNGEIRGQLWLDKKLAFDANLTGTQQVPPVITAAVGVASVKLNTTLDTVWYNLVAADLSGPINAAHFHSGVIGSNGSPIVDIGSSIHGNRIDGTITGTALTASFITRLLDGSLYLNLHTTANPNGEIRGQVYSLKREGLVSIINGAQQIPPVTTTGYGAAIVSIDRTLSNAHYMYVAGGLSGTASAAHFHAGAANQTGGVLYDLVSTSAFSGTNASGFGYLNNTGTSPLTVANAQKILNDSTYINIHTAANPNGEIRGQIIKGALCFTSTSDVKENAKNVQAISVYPNPVGDILNIKLEAVASAKATIAIYDLLGKQVVIAQTINLNKGNNEYKINLSGIDAGIYFVTLQNDANTIIEKVVKQ